VKTEFFLAVPPKATARNRCGCRGKYPISYPADSYKKWLAVALPKLQELAPDLSEEVRAAPVAVTVEAIAQRPKTTKRFFPRGDNDNYEKGLWDAMTKVGAWWNDDDQIFDNRTIKRWTEDGEEPGYRVRLEYDLERKL